MVMGFPARKYAAKMERICLAVSRVTTAFSLFLLLAGTAGAATVLSVGDGDTLRVVDGGKRLTIRVGCIDAPETAQRPYGAASRQRLAER
jgi:endonuclease YncB( thermonuclease family)